MAFRRDINYNIILQLDLFIEGEGISRIFQVPSLHFQAHADYDYQFSNKQV